MVTDAEHWHEHYLSLKGSILIFIHMKHLYWTDGDLQSFCLWIRSDGGSVGGFSVIDILLWLVKMNSFHSKAPWVWLSHSRGGYKAVPVAGPLAAAFVREPRISCTMEVAVVQSCPPVERGKIRWSTLSHMYVCIICLVCWPSSCSDSSLHYHQVKFGIRMCTAGTRSRI